MGKIQHSRGPRYATTHIAGNDEFMLHLLGVAEGIVAIAWVSTGLQWRSNLKQTPVEWIEQVMIRFATSLSFWCLCQHVSLDSVCMSVCGLR